MSKSKHIFLNGVKYEKDNILSAEAMEKSLIILLNVCDGEKIKDVTIQYHNINNFKADRVKLNKLMEELHKQQEEYYDLLKASHNKPLIDEALENADKLNSFDFSLKQILSLTSNELKLFMFLKIVLKGRNMYVSKDLCDILDMTRYEIESAVAGLIEKEYLNNIEK